MGTKKLTLLGALFAQSVSSAALPKPLRKLVDKARLEITSDLDGKQFKVWKKAGRPTFEID